MPEANIEPEEDFRRRLRGMAGEQHAPRSSTRVWEWRWRKVGSATTKNSRRSRTKGNCNIGCSTPDSLGSASRKSMEVKA